MSASSHLMKKKCPECLLVNFANADRCVRCGAAVRHVSVSNSERKRSRLAIRTVICFCVSVAVILGFYLSLLASASSLNIDQKSEVRQAIAVLRERGFTDEAFLLDNVAVFKGEDNWLNASVAKENAYAATNFPFEIITLYPDFFTYPQDTTERAAILLHESKHLSGADEREAYTFVWKNRRQLGWTSDKYVNSPIWRNVRRQTSEVAPEIFNCPGKDMNDCTQ